MDQNHLKTEGSKFFLAIPPMSCEYSTIFGRSPKLMASNAEAFGSATSVNNPAYVIDSIVVVVHCSTEKDRVCGVA